MKLTELFLGQLDSEAAISRRVLERVPEGRSDWKPHAKSMPLGYLSVLVASMPSWVGMAIQKDELDLNPPGGGSYTPKGFEKREELLQSLDKTVAESRAALSGTDDDYLKTTWKLLVAGRVVLEQPRYAVIRDVFTHLAHHRGQLTVYLRLNDVPVPSVYGPTADDARF
jgi:uncharacterized damage-inducible protein DinB